jgi:hypothetical protein
MNVPCFAGRDPRHDYILLAMTTRLKKVSFYSSFGEGLSSQLRVIRGSARCYIPPTGGIDSRIFTHKCGWSFKVVYSSTALPCGVV